MKYFAREYSSSARLPEVALLLLWYLEFTVQFIYMEVGDPSFYLFMVAWDSYACGLFSQGFKG